MAQQLHGFKQCNNRAFNNITISKQLHSHKQDQYHSNIEYQGTHGGIGLNISIQSTNFPSHDLIMEIVRKLFFHEFKQTSGLELGSWPKEIHTWFTTPVIPKSKEWLVVNCVKNVTMSILLGFYIFKGERLKDNYIKFYKSSTCIAMQKPRHGW